MATQTIEQVQRLAPYLEGIEQRLLNTAFGQYDDSGAQTAPGLLDTALNLPQQKVAGLDPLQQQALNMAPGMVGSYAPFTLGAAGQTLGGQASLASGLGLCLTLHLPPPNMAIHTQCFVSFRALVQLQVGLVQLAVVCTAFLHLA